MKLNVLLIGVIALLTLNNVSAEDRNVFGDTARGAAKGAIIGGIAGDAGKGAAAGAVGSALFGGMRRSY